MRPTRVTACAAAGPTSSRRPTSATSATTAAPSAATGGRSCSAGHGDRARRARSRLVHPRDACGKHPRPASPPGPLQRLQRARRRSGGAGCSARRSRTIRGGLERFDAAFGRFERIAVGDKSAPHPPDQEPGRRERGRAHTPRRGCSPTLLLVALNDAIADGKDVSWIWDVDFEPLLGAGGTADRLGRPGRRAGRSVRLRRARRGGARGGAGPRAGARPGSRATPAGR